MIKNTSLFLAFFLSICLSIVISCKRVKPKQCQCCPCGKAPAKVKIDFSQKRKKLAEVSQILTGPQLCKLNSIHALDNLTNEQLAKLRKRFFQSFFPGENPSDYIAKVQKKVPLENLAPPVK